MSPHKTINLAIAFKTVSSKKFLSDQNFPSAKQTPNIARWVEEHEEILELGYDVDSPRDSFVRAIDCGGMPWSGKDSYESIDAALQDADDALAGVLKDIYGE